MSSPRRRNLLRLLAILAATALLWAVLLPFIASDNVRMDSDRMFFHADEAMSQYLREGRGGLVLLLRLFGLTRWDPLRSGILFLLFFSASSWLFCFFLYRRACWKNEGLCLLFFLLYACSQIWLFHAYFVLQIAGVGFGMLLCTLAAGGDAACLAGREERKSLRVLREILSLAALSFSLTVYQSLILHYLAVLAVLMFAHFLREGKDALKSRPFLLSLSLIALRILLSLAIYYLVARLTRGDADSGNVAAQFKWGTDSVWHCLYRILQEIGATMILYQSRYFSLFPLAAVLGFLLWRRHRSLPLLLTGLLLLLLPFALSFFLGNVTVPRSQFVLQAVAAFVPVCFLAESPKPLRWLRVVCVCTVVLQVALSLRLVHTDNRRNEVDTSAGQRILSELEPLDPEKPLVFLGNLKLEDSSLLVEHTDVFGRTFFDWIYEEDKPYRSTTPGIRLLRALSDRDFQPASSSLMKKAAKKAAKEDQPAYPAPGFVRETDRYILIRLE